MDRGPYRGEGRGRGRRGRGGRGRGRANYPVQRRDDDGYLFAGDREGRNQGGWNRRQHPRGAAEASGAVDNSHDRDNRRQNRADKPVRPLGYKTLEEIASLQSSEAVHRLSAHQLGLEKLIRESEIRFDLMIQLTSALAKACSCKTSQETLMVIVGVLQAENFVTNHLTKFIQELPHMLAMKSSYKDVIPNLLGDSLGILLCMLVRIQSLFKDVELCLLCMEISMERCRASGVVFSADVSKKLCDLKESVEAIVNEIHEKQVAAANRERPEQDDGMIPEDDFRAIPIFPRADELQEDYRPFLRKNVVNKGYNNPQHYLDIQFRLLREDFVAPLRNGIAEYRALSQSKDGKQHNNYVYDDVQVLQAIPHEDGIVYTTRFNVKRLPRIQWDRSRRLLFGSLVCLSSDDFRNVIFAVVVNRKPERLKEGLIELELHRQAKLLPTLFSQTYKMVESSAYFEAYRYVLKRMQAITDETFPLEKYITRADPCAEFPFYLRQDPNVQYNLTSVVKQGIDVNTVVTNPGSWPPVQGFNLDSSQLQAFKAALTEELCCIQGPPGTGKTFIGLKIVETLLRNKTVWSPDDDSSPILLICQTNHALDQFLEGILEFLPNGIVRIGGRSRSEKLKDFTLKELRRSKPRLKHRYWERKNIQNRKLKIVDQLHDSQKTIAAANTGILKETKLMEVIPHKQYQSLLTEYNIEEAPNLKTGELIAFWLGAIGGGPGTALMVRNEEDPDLHADVAPPLFIGVESRTGRRLRSRRPRENILEGRTLQEYISRNLRVTEQMSEDEYTEAADVWSLDMRNRWRLYRHWITRHQENLQMSLRIANGAILKTSILRPYMKHEHVVSLERGMPNVHREQHLGVFLGVCQQGLTAEKLEESVGLVHVQNEEERTLTMQDYMENYDETCKIEISHRMMILIVKGLVHIEPMNGAEADQIENVTALGIYKRWELYKYWVTLYREKLQECLTISTSNVLREDVLRHQMTANQIESFYGETHDDNIKNIDHGQRMLLWLGAYSGVPVAAVQVTFNDLPQEDEEIDTEMLNEDRYLDDGRDEEINEALETVSGIGEEDEVVDLADRIGNEKNQGWETAGGKRYLEKQLRMNKRMSKEEVRDIENVWKLGPDKRWELYRYWVHTYKERDQNLTLPLQEEFEKQTRLLQEVKMEEDYDIIKDATIIALTTTGASKFHYLIERVHPRIVIVEEAAEVLEAHIVTSLTEKCQHLILIGDHQQLRPNPTVYKLAKDYHLDISLFERLIKNNFPKHRLDVQHRMRPEISSLLRIHEDFYPDLEDDVSVLSHENIRGIETNVYFLDHDHPESAENDDRTKFNEFEADFLSGLCRYLLHQGYMSDQITIITAYTGQLWKFKQRMHESVFGNVHVCPIDRYQGEENDIILLSLVRSNQEGNIGFLKIANRVCVALSRAKKGLYCVGNFSLLSNQSDVWKAITGYLSERGQLGKAMTLTCSNHPDVSTEVRISDDFLKVPEGGCKNPCQARLNCGHVCPKICHPRDADHVEVKCTRECTKLICDQLHRCKRMCYQDCDKECKETIERELECGHVKRIRCYLKTSPDVQCIEPCPKILNCGHPCNKNCSDACTAHCKQLVERKFKCGHIGDSECGGEDEHCTEPCGTILKCGHACSGSCDGCKRGRLHVSCSRPCGRELICGHVCKATCSKWCSPCEERCENHCLHSKCPKRCGQPCTPCIEKGKRRCKHGICIKRCGEPCDRPPCNAACERRLPRCHHECVGLCGDICPKRCRLCDEKETSNGHEDGPYARFVLLEDCRHLIEVETLDAWMEQRVGEDATIVQVRVCPECKTPIRNNQRYRNAIKQARADVERINRRLLGDPVSVREKRKDLLRDLSMEDAQHIRKKNLKRLSTELTKRGTVPPQDDTKTAASTGTLMDEIRTGLYSVGEKHTPLRQYRMRERNRLMKALPKKDAIPPPDDTITAVFTGTSLGEIGTLLYSVGEKREGLLRDLSKEDAQPIRKRNLTRLSTELAKKDAVPSHDSTTTAGSTGTRLDEINTGLYSVGEKHTTLPQYRMRECSRLMKALPKKDAIPPPDDATTAVSTGASLDEIGTGLDSVGEKRTKLRQYRRMETLPKKDEIPPPDDTTMAVSTGGSGTGLEEGGKRSQSDIPTAAFTGSAGKKFIEGFRCQLSRSATEIQMKSLGHKMKMFKRLCKIKRKSQKIEMGNGNYEKRIILDRFLEDILVWLGNLSDITDQNVEDWNSEMKRISAFIKLMEVRPMVSVTLHPRAEDIMKKIYIILSNEGRYSEQSERNAQPLFENLSKCGPSIGESEEGENMAVKSVGPLAGHWFKCRNGHLYAIGEERGTTEMRRCPECKYGMDGSRNFASWITFL